MLIEPRDRRLSIVECKWKDKSDIQSIVFKPDVDRDGGCSKA